MPGKSFWKRQPFEKLNFYKSQIGFFLCPSNLVLTLFDDYMLIVKCLHDATILERGWLKQKRRLRDNVYWSLNVQKPGSCDTALIQRKKSKRRYARMIIAHLSSLGYDSQGEVFQTRPIKMMPSGCLSFVCINDISLYAK